MRDIETSYINLHMFMYSAITKKNGRNGNMMTISTNVLIDLTLRERIKWLRPWEVKGSH